MITAIAAVDANYGIGKVDPVTGKGRLLFNLPKDLAWFKGVTLNNIIVMGYSTYMSLPVRPLKNRINIVLWDKATSIDCLEGCLTFSNFNELLYTLQLLSEQFNIYICGGASIYELFLPYCDNIMLTHVAEADPEATAFFPDLRKHPEFVPFDKGLADIIDNGHKTQTVWYKRLKDYQKDSRTNG
jgi:dihydrofolate reductase